MAFNASVLKDWNDIDNSLTIKAIVKNRLSNIKGLRQISDVKGSIEVPFLYSAPSFTNITCNTTTSGQTSLGTTTVSTVFISYHEELCSADLQGKTFSKDLTDLSESMPFESELAEEAAMQVQKMVEKQWLQGHPSVAVDGLLCTGLYYLLDSNTASTVNVTYTAATAANGVSVMDAYLANIPDAAREMPAITVGLKPADFQAFKIAFRNANLVQYTEQDADADTFKVPGYDNIWLVKLPGNAGVNKAFITYGENLIEPYNINSGIELYYDKSKRKFVRHADLRLGAGVHFPDHVVYIK